MNHLSREAITHPSFNRIAYKTAVLAELSSHTDTNGAHMSQHEHLYSLEINEQKSRALSLLHRHQQEHTQQQCNTSNTLLSLARKEAFKPDSHQRAIRI